MEHAEDEAGAAIYARRFDSFAGKDAAGMLRELADRELIRDLTHSYAHRVAHGLANADLFTDVGAYIHRRTLDDPGHVTRGRAALDAHFAPRPGTTGGAMPMIHNHLIEIDGDEARATCSIELRVSADGESMIASGFYRDRLRREGGVWKFVERDVAFFH